MEYESVAFTHTIMATPEAGQSRGKYEDIINMPHHVSKVHPPMELLQRAAQFAPFAALTGYEDAVREMARRTEETFQ